MQSLSANRVFGIAAKRRLFNQLIGERDQRWWNIEAKCFRGLEIKHKSNLVGCKMGRSLGFSPLRMRPT